MKVVILGADGQLGRSLRECAPARNDLRALTRAQCDISDRAAVFARIGELRPDLVINCAAYTAVDRAEDEPRIAEAVNAGGAGHIAAACAARRARLIHISTDYVFDGKQGHACRPEDATAPLNAYGRSKAEGERRVLGTAGLDAVIVRSAWLYSRHGRNFVLTVLRALREKPELRVVDDQLGSPTWCGALAQALWMIAPRSGLRGILHWTNAGAASWYDFAMAIAEESQRLGLSDGTTRILPIPSTEFPARAERPRFAVLDKQECWRRLGDSAPHWRSSLRDMLSGLSTSSLEQGSEHSRQC